MKNQGKIKVENIIVSDQRPKVRDKEIAKLLPNTLFPQGIKFRVSPVSNAVSSAIRRTVTCELPVRSMVCDRECITTTDVFIIPDMVMKRFKMIPIDQSVSMDAVFDLEVENTSSVEIDVKSSSLRGRGMKHSPFNHTYTLFTLKPEKSIKITGITVQEFYGYIVGDGMCVLGYQGASTAVDVKPINVFDPHPDQISCRESNAQVWDIAFNTNGTMPAKDIVAFACDVIIERLKSVIGLLDTIEYDNDIYTLIIPGESHTIGNLFMRTICDMFPNVDAVVYDSDQFVRQAKIRIRYESDIRAVFITTIKYLTDVYTQIKSYFK